MELKEELERSEELTEEDALLAERIAAAAEEAPPTLRTGVWLRINQERKRRRRARYIRYAGVAACLLIVVPAALRLVPRLTKSVPTADAAEAEIVQQAEETVAATATEAFTTTEETYSIYNGKDDGGMTPSNVGDSDNRNYKGAAAPPADTPAPAAAATAPAAGPSGTETAAPATTQPLRSLTASAPTEATTAAPEGKGQFGSDDASVNGVPAVGDSMNGAGETTAGETTAAATTTAPPQRLMSKKASAPAVVTENTEEDAAARAARVLRTMLGTDGAPEVAYDAWLAEKPTGSPYAYVKQFGVTREAFLAAAEKLGIVFTEDELAALFGTAEVKE